MFGILSGDMGSDPAVALSRSIPRQAEFGNKLATTLAVSTQCHYIVSGCSVNRKYLQFMVLQHQPSVIALRRGSKVTRFECCFQEPCNHHWHILARFDTTDQQTFPQLGV
jgi:hypothetical protein